MKVIAYAAISIDGYIARPDGDSDWVKPEDQTFFDQEIKKHGCIIIGRKTFTQFKGQIYPVKDVLNIVLTSDPTANKSTADLTFISGGLQKALELAAAKGKDSVLLVGGGKLLGSFLDAGLIDELWVDIHPLVLGKGIKLFESEACFAELERIETFEPGKGLLLVHYRLKDQHGR
jgi:dihydrofolate reductase